MRGFRAVLIAASLMGTVWSMAAQQANGTHHWAIVVHGGAGVIERKTMDAKTEAAYRTSLAEALGAGA
jgi:beta-aspartyl-peptidase (threonine type)